MEQHNSLLFLRVYRVRLIVDDVMIDESFEALTYRSIVLHASPMFIGGLDDNVQLDDRLPIRSSLIGGISGVLRNTG